MQDPGHTLVSCFEGLLAHSPNARVSFHTAALVSTTGSVATTMWNILLSKVSLAFQAIPSPLKYPWKTNSSMIPSVSPYCFDLETWDLPKSVYTKIYTANVYQINEFHMNPRVEETPTLLRSPTIWKSSLRPTTLWLFSQTREKVFQWLKDVLVAENKCCLQVYPNL